MKGNANIYMPHEASIQEVRDFTPDVKLFTVSKRPSFDFMPGQYFMLSVLGHGEVPISVASGEGEPLMFCIKKVGRVTGALHALKAGDRIGLRGPYGNRFPFELAKGRDVVLMAGGIGIIPLRPVIRELMGNRKDYGALYLLYGCRLKDEQLFRHEIPEWEASGFSMIYGLRGKAVEGEEACAIRPHNLEHVDADLAGATAFVCGPHSMIELSMQELVKRGMPDERIITTLEAHMKCGVGKCGHCFLGPRYICTDGPVFTFKELKGLSKV
jgi:NAD(P)H-flavin reductase